MLSLDARNMYTKFSSTCKNNKYNKLIISSTLIIILIIVVTTSFFHANSSRHSMHVVSKFPTTNMITSACAATLYPNACINSFASISSNPSSSSNDLFSASVQFAIHKVESARSLTSKLNLLSIESSTKTDPTGLDDCLELLEATHDQLNDVMNVKSANHHDIKTWLSAALTYQQTCSESLNQENNKASSELNSQVQSLSQFISNSLALYKHLKNNSNGRNGRKLLSKDDRFPEWVSVGDRKLLEASIQEIVPDAVVAKDGSGTHGTINEAIAFLSMKSSGGGERSVIYVKAGTYKENVNIPTKQKKVMLMGDGRGVSVIVGSRSVGGGSTTYNSATVAAMGAGFIAKDLTIINDAGPSKHQAVALRVGSDQSVIYQCSLQGYQDTLYTLSNRQFYTSTDISGTVDFIFGNSAAVLQNCFIQPIKPNGGQKNSVTAQGREDPNQNTGISIHKSKIQCSSDVGGTTTYLGRPWQKYSRVVIMATYLDDCISSAGWEPWSGGFALSTLYYGEYANTGPGAGTSGRVKWGGVVTEMSEEKAEEFTVGNFIYGDYWLPGTGVSYIPGL